MKNRKYTQKKITIRNRRRNIHMNNNKMGNKELLRDIKMLTSIKKLQNGNVIGILAKKNKKLTQEQINAIRLDINNQRLFGIKLSKHFKIMMKMKPNKVLTSKGILVRMGKGKGKIKTKAIYLLKDSVCIELKIPRKKKINQNFTPLHVQNLFKKFLKKHTYFYLKTSIKL